MTGDSDPKEVKELDPASPTDFIPAHQCPMSAPLATWRLAPVKLRKLLGVVLIIAGAKMFITVSSR